MSPATGIRAALIDRCWFIYLSLTGAFTLPEDFHVEFPVAAPLTWVEVPADQAVTDHWTFVNGVFVAPPAPPPVSTPAEQAEAAFAGRPELKGLARVLAKRFSLTEAQVVAAIKAELP